jgi:hypothetical protein
VDEGIDDTLDPEMVDLREKIRTAIGIHLATPVNSRDHSPWEVMHWVIAFGVDSQIRMGGPQGQPATAVGWICYNRRSRGQQIFYDAGPEFGLQHGPGVQGHEGQLLAVLAQSRVPAEYPIKVAKREFTVGDLVEREKMHCQGGGELTFQLIGLSHYLDSEETWVSGSGQSWSIERMVREELAQPIHGAACGGSHRLMGLSYALAKRAKQGHPIDGDFRRARIFIDDYHDYTLKLQNRDGSFSTEWFVTKANAADPARKLQTTGHILEWLVYSLPDERLSDPRVVRATEFLSDLLIEQRTRNWRIGPLGHALHALVLYDQRVFGGTIDDWRRPVQLREKVLTAQGRR